MDFYMTVVQIIPVFFLAMAFESGLFFRRPDSYVDDPDQPAMWNASQIAGIAAIVVVMAVGEVAGLVAIYGQRKNGLTNALVWYGLIAGLLGVIIPILSYQWGLLKLHRTSGGRSGVSIQGWGVTCGFESGYAIGV